jgi:hypothetical protein
MPTLGQLSKERLSVELNDVSTVLYTTARREQAINDAQEEFADRTECLVREMAIACSCNVTEYSLISSATGSTDFVRFAKQGVEYLFTDSNGLVTQLAGDDFLERPIQYQNRTEPGWRGSTTPVQTPRGWYRRQDGGDLRIGLYDPPKIGSSQTGVLKVPYVVAAQAMASTSAVPFTLNSTVRTDLAVYHKALAHYAAYRLLPLIGDSQGALVQLQLFDTFVNRYESQQRPRGGQRVSYATNYLQRARGGRDDKPMVPGWTWR